MIHELLLALSGYPGTIFTWNKRTGLQVKLRSFVIQRTPSAVLFYSGSDKNSVSSFYFILFYPGLLLHIWVHGLTWTCVVQDHVFYWIQIQGGSGWSGYRPRTGIDPDLGSLWLVWNQIQEWSGVFRLFLLKHFQNISCDLFILV